MPKRPGNLNRLQQYAANKLVGEAIKGKTKAGILEQLVTFIENVPGAKLRDLRRSIAKNVKEDIRRRLKWQEAAAIRDEYMTDPVWIKLCSALGADAGEYIDKIILEA